MTTPSEVNAGRVVGVFGVRGELKIDASRIGAGSLRPGVAVRAQLADGSARVLHVRALRMHKGRPLATFAELEDATAAAAVVGASLAVARADVALEAGEYFDADLVGCRVFDAGAGDVGAVLAVEHYPAQDMLVVGASRALVPLVGEFVKAVDVAGKRIDVALPPGLIDERDAERA
ncbi:MAG: ribosome maturation factor RimM [Candidatus Velthaea sp.]